MIEKYCESDVLEIRGEVKQVQIDSLSEEWRTEQAGDSLYLYANDAQGLVQFSKNLTDMVCLHRRAGLEDVFLRLTGRALRG